MKIIKVKDNHLLHLFLKIKDLGKSQKMIYKRLIPIFQFKKFVDFFIKNG